METKEIEHYFADSTILQENPEEAEELVNLAGYQVTKAELFAHTREPAITIWDSRIKFIQSRNGLSSAPATRMPRTPSAGPEAAGKRSFPIEIFCAKSLRQKSLT